MNSEADRSFANGTKVLEMTIGEESRAKESRIGRRDSFLYECYLKSFDVMSETILHAKRFHQHSSNHDLINYYTNVIAFDGARGRGKTSAMLTFGRTLDGLNKLSRAANAREREHVLDEVFDNPDEELRKAVNSLGNSTFVVLPPIDPAVLVKSHDLLSTFTARLYQKAQVCWENDQQNGSSAGTRRSSLVASSYAVKDEFLDDIKECYTAISALKDGGDGGAWSMSQLSKMGAASELSRHFQDAVCSLLELHHMSPEHGFVVLQIDDADMTFASVYEILEDIRCFLKIPNLVVLMATDLTMIENLVRESFMKQTEHSEDFIQELTEQYMIKYFPLRRQIALPDLNNILHHDVQHVGMRVWTDESRTVDLFSELYEREDEGADHRNALCMSTALLRMLFRRTGVLLDDTKGYYPWLLPVSQRSLAGFVGLLYQMKRVGRLERLDRVFDSGSSQKSLTLYYPCEELDNTMGEYVRDLNKWLENVRLLQYYLLHDWALGALTHEEGVQFQKIARSSIWDRRITTFKALQALGVEGLNFDNTRDFRKLTDALDMYKKKHGPRFSYAVRVLESLFAQEYILETLLGRFSDEKKSEHPSDERRGEYYTPFLGLRSFYSGNMVLSGHTLTAGNPIVQEFEETAGGWYKHLFDLDLARQPEIQGPEEGSEKLCKLLFSLCLAKQSESLTESVHQSPEEPETPAQCVRLDAPLFNSLYMCPGTMGAIPGSLIASYDVQYMALLLPLQDLMLFLASNWDAMRNVLKYLKDSNNSKLVSTDSLSEFCSSMAAFYKGNVENGHLSGGLVGELLGTINKPVLEEIAENIVSWLSMSEEARPLSEVSGE